MLLTSKYPLLRSLGEGVGSIETGLLDLGPAELLRDVPLLNGDRTVTSRSVFLSFV